MKNRVSGFKILIFLAVILIAGGIFSFSLTVHAATGSYDYTQLEKIPGSESAGSDLKSFIDSIYKFGIWTVGIAAVLMITIGGFMYLTSAGNNSKAESAKKVITDAIIGLIVALAAYLILYVINPDLININISMKPLGTVGVTEKADGTACSPACTSSQICQKSTCVSAPKGGTSNAKCSDLNSSLNSSLNSADNGVPPALLAAFIKRECASAMSNPNACGSNNSYGAGGSMQFIDTTWSQYKCSGSKFNQQDALKCAAKKISKDSGGDYSEAGIRKAAKAYCGSCTDPKACGGNYCDGIVNNYNNYKSCSI